MIDTSRTVIVKTVIAAPYDVVWNALREPDVIRQWHGWQAATLDDEIAVIYDQYAAADEAAGTIDFAGIETRFELQRSGSDTVARVTKATPDEDAAWETYYDEVEEGWITFVHQLKLALERHPGQARNTIHLDGLAGSGRGPLTAEALGLDDAARTEPGQRFADTSLWGESFAGEVLFRARHQVGFTVDGYGDGLVVAHAQPADARPPRGGGKIIVTLYGLDSGTVDVIGRRWQNWFDEHYVQALQT